MAIKEQVPVTMAEVASLAGDTENGKKIKAFVKKFTKISAEKAIEMKDELKALDLIRLKDEDIVKIVDFLPVDAAELNKVCPESSLSQEEIDKVLGVVGKFK